MLINVIWRGNGHKSLPSYDFHKSGMPVTPFSFELHLKGRPTMQPSTPPTLRPRRRSCRLRRRRPEASPATALLCGARPLRGDAARGAFRPRAPRSRHARDSYLIDVGGSSGGLADGPRVPRACRQAKAESRVESAPVIPASGVPHSFPATPGHSRGAAAGWGPMSAVRQRNRLGFEATQSRRACPKNCLRASRPFTSANSARRYSARSVPGT
jgi:hypothetical protein